MGKWVDVALRESGGTQQHCARGALKNSIGDGFHFRLPPRLGCTAKVVAPFKLNIHDIYTKLKHNTRVRGYYWRLSGQAGEFRQVDDYAARRLDSPFADASDRTAN